MGRSHDGGENEAGNDGQALALDEAVVIVLGSSAFWFMCTSPLALLFSLVVSMYRFSAAAIRAGRPLQPLNFGFQPFQALGQRHHQSNQFVARQVTQAIRSW
jgi:hypothetical protein